MEKFLKCPKCGEVFEVDEAGYAAILNQVRNAEFDEELSKREDSLKAQLQELQKVQLESAKLEYDKALNAVKSELSLKQAEIERLNSQITHLNSDKKKDAQLAEEKAKSDMKAQLNKKDISISQLNATIDSLNSQIAQLNSDKEKEVQLAVSQTEIKQMEQLKEKELEIAELRNQVTQTENNAQLKLNSVKENYDFQLKQKDDTIEYYKNLKAKQSTKMIGEELERYCHQEFNKVRAIAYPNAYFEKDNDAIKVEGETKGTKGDFIFRDYAIDGDEKIEYISIMFEMKNEADKTATKKKNEDFFAKLDKDRRKKNCEYAVLVSLLEEDNKEYSDGIADVSYRYPKMFVVRPQFFMTIIALLCSASRNTIPLKKQLAEARQQDFDVTNFETKLNNFKSLFGQRFHWAASQFNNAIDDIDKIIKYLSKMKEELLLTGKHLNFANNHAIGLTIKKLTSENPTMEKKFEEARKQAKEIEKYAEDVEEEEENTEEYVEIKEGDFGYIPEVEKYDDVEGAESFYEGTDAEKP